MCTTETSSRNRCGNQMNSRRASSPSSSDYIRVSLTTKLEAVAS
jgi:hypothetical protein